MTSSDGQGTQAKVVRVVVAWAVVLFAACDVESVSDDPVVDDAAAHDAAPPIKDGRIDGGARADAALEDSAPPAPDASAFDAGRLDAAPFDVDDAGRELDALVPPPPPPLPPPEDAGPPPPPDDAAPPPEGPACNAAGRAGTCLHVDDCGGESVPGFCPGPANIQCCVEPRMPGGACDEDPAWAAMPRPNEGLVEAPGDPGCPPGMAGLDGFCVDRYEGALVERLADGAERSWSPFFSPAGRDVRAVSIRGAVPQSQISGRQAAAACAAAGKRLCSDAEWLRACRGAADRVYPYGDARQPGVCNDAWPGHPAVEYFGSADNWVFSMLDNPCINQQADTVASGGDHPGCVTPEGVYDLMGNLHEWTADPQGTFRGGYYVDTVRNGDGCLYRTTAHDFGYSDYSTGFRCCADRR